MHATLAKTLALSRCRNAKSTGLGENELELDSIFKAAKIRRTRSTKNRFTPFVKLIFPELSERTTISRYAGVLLIADRHNVNPADLSLFIASKGGIVACAKLASDAKTNSAKASSKPNQKDLRKLRKGARPLTAREFETIGAGPLYVALIEKDQDGMLFLLSARSTDEVPAALKMFRGHR